MTAQQPVQSPWTPREAELLEVTLRLLQDRGYDRLTMDEVAASARASKATVYRRWPSKAKLVLAAFMENVRRAEVVPDSGSLREDLLQMGYTLAQKTNERAGMIRAVFMAAAYDSDLRDAIEREFLTQRRELVLGILKRAIERGEIDVEVIENDLWDLLPGYLIFRSIMPGRSATDDTVRALVDDVLLPSLTRTRR